MTEIAVDFLFVASVFAFVSPLIISLLKNIGGEWPERVKQALAMLMALIGSVIAVGVSSGWSAIALNDWAGFWQPLIVGVGGIFAVQYATYMAVWKDTRIEVAAAGVGDSG